MVCCGGSKIWLTESIGSYGPLLCIPLFFGCLCLHCCVAPWQETVGKSDLHCIRCYYITTLFGGALYYVVMLYTALCHASWMLFLATAPLLLSLPHGLPSEQL